MHERDVIVFGLDNVSRTTQKLVIKYPCVYSDVDVKRTLRSALSFEHIMEVIVYKKLSYRKETVRLLHNIEIKILH